MPPRRIEPGPGQESVWDYPRPPRIEDTRSHVVVMFDGGPIAETTRARRVLETSHPPVYYISPEDVRLDLFVHAPRRTLCEWKGSASYYHLDNGRRRAKDVAWSYEDPTPAFEPIRGFIAFYPSKVDACTVDGRLVQAQPGDFYGGWITSEVVGPFKGDPGTMGW